MNFIVSIVIFLLLLAPVGCGQSEPAEDDHEHHLEHFVPGHKPSSFAEAVDQLEHRAEHLQFHIGDESEVVQAELQELADIIGWLPELAADSDLGEADWQAVDVASGRMMAAFEESSSGKTLESFLSAIQPQIEGLQPLVPRAGEPEPAIHHGHDHHGHDHHEHDHHEHDHHGHDPHEHDPHEQPAEQVKTQSGDIVTD